MLSPAVVVLFKNNFFFIPFFDKVKDKVYIIRMCMPETKSRIFFLLWADSFSQICTKTVIWNFFARPYLQLTNKLLKDL